MCVLYVNFKLFKMNFERHLSGEIDFAIVQIMHVKNKIVELSNITSNKLPTCLTQNSR